MLQKNFLKMLLLLLDKKNPICYNVFLWKNSQNFWKKSWQKNFSCCCFFLLDKFPPVWYNTRRKNFDPDGKGRRKPKFKTWHSTSVYGRRNDRSADGKAKEKRGLFALYFFFFVVFDFVFFVVVEVFSVIVV